MFDIFLNEFKYISNIYIAIFVIVDPFAVVPVYLSLTSNFSKEQRKTARVKAALIAGAILIIFALSGMAIFKVFGITLPAFQIAGGILLLKFGLDQLSGNRPRVKPEEKEESYDREDISVFPLATPLLAGPGSISTVVLYSTKVESTIRSFSLIIAVVATMLSCYGILRFSPLLYKVFGKTGLNLFTRLMGIMLTAIAIQFIVNGLEGVFKQFGFIS